MLSAAELEGMNATLEASLPDACVISSGALVPDGAGGGIPDPAASTITVACRVSPSSDLVRNAEDVEAARIASQAPWLITVPRGTSVAQPATIASGGHVFEVAAVLGPRSWAIGMRVFCRELR